MTIESKIPLNELKQALYNYSGLYNCIHTPIGVYNYKTRIAKKTFWSLFLSLVKIGLLILFINLTVSAMQASSNDHPILNVLFFVLSFVFGISVFLDLFYFQKQKGKKLPKLKVRYTYYIKSFVNDVIELHWFRKFFGVKTPAFFLVFGFGKKQVYENITAWGYVVGEDYVRQINDYDQKYSNYRDYVDLGQHWYLCSELLDIINSGRASDIKGALAVVDTRKHRENVERYQRQQAESAMEMAASAASAAASAADAAHSLNNIETYEKQQRDYLEQIRNALM